MPLVEKELSTLPEDVSIPICFSGVRVTQSLAVTRQVPLVKKELLTLQEVVSLPLCISDVRVTHTQSLVFCVVFCRPLFVIITLCHCIVCPSSRITSLDYQLDIWELFVDFYWFMVFNATFNNISVISRRSNFLVEETGVPGENHRPTAAH